MVTLHAEPAPPRAARVAVPEATYRVSYWRQSAVSDFAERPANLEQVDMAWESEEWLVSGGSAFEVLAWADDGADGWQVTEVCAVVPDAYGKAVGLVRLLGYDPTADEGC
jgi:hypothetical protein